MPVLIRKNKLNGSKINGKEGPVLRGRTKIHPQPLPVSRRGQNNRGAKVPYIHTELPGPKARAAIKLDRRFTSPSYTRYIPLAVKRASMCTVEDLDGNRFLDFTAGIAVNNCGHCHPQIVAAVR